MSSSPSGAALLRAGLGSASMAHGAVFLRPALSLPSKGWEQPPSQPPALLPPHPIPQGSGLLLAQHRPTKGVTRAALGHSEG